ncbi:MAG: RNA methyltransferase [Bdellovibrionota bacterium]
MKIIESKSNSYFKVLQKILKTPGVKKEKLFLMMGPKVVEEHYHHELVKSILVVSEMPHLEPSLKKKIVMLTPELYEELDIFETRAPLIVMDLPKIPLWEPKPPKGVELFLPVQDPANLGAIVRSAVAFGVKKIILLKESAHPFHPKAVKASSGMVLKTQFEIGPSIQELHNHIDRYVSLDGDGVSLEKFDWPKDVSLLVGEEGLGLPKTLKHNAVSIPINADVESLNVMAATSIALYDYSKKMIPKGN